MGTIVTGAFALAATSALTGLEALRLQLLVHQGSASGAASFARHCGIATATTFPAVAAVTLALRRALPLPA
jgi:hypothetical protein